MTKTEIYLDNSSTTRPYDEVAEHMKNIALYEYGNPSSLNNMGIRAESILKKARADIADSLDVKPSEIYFTSGGTESNNLAIFGYLKANPRRGRHIITSQTEHPSVLETFKSIEQSGYEADYISVSQEGIVNVEELEEKLRKDTALVSIMLVNNETGAISPIEQISRIINKINPSTVLHVDAVQAYGKMHIYPERSHIDLMTMSSHKIHGPKGLGALYIKNGTKMAPLFYGGGQETELRSGTENVPGAAGFGLAACISMKRLDDDINKCRLLKDELKKGIQTNVQNTVFVSSEDSLPFILNVSFPGVRAEVLLHFLEQRNIYVSTGSACHSKRKSRSHVLTAMSLNEDIIDGAIRFSFSSFNTIDEIGVVVNELKNIVPELRETYGKRR
ncbi:MAG: cysteine desulfurase family protein [Eubacteriales bacterium]|nr:cysteine desulfurase family protein [Eubacteriales bacterium]